jgi:hypothetical protein
MAPCISKEQESDSYSSDIDKILSIPSPEKKMDINSNPGTLVRIK